MKKYATLIDGKIWRVADTRVSLDSIVHAWNQGRSPERIRLSFPTLTLVEVYGTLTFYLENKDMIDQYITDGQTQYHSEWKEQQQNITQNPLLRNYLKTKTNNNI